MFHPGPGYNLYDDDTGWLYQPDGPEKGASGQTCASGSPH